MIFNKKSSEQILSGPLLYGIKIRYRGFLCCDSLFAGVGALGGMAARRCRLENLFCWFCVWFILFFRKASMKIYSLHNRLAFLDKIKNFFSWWHDLKQISFETSNVWRARHENPPFQTRRFAVVYWNKNSGVRWRWVRHLFANRFLTHTTHKTHKAIQRKKALATLFLPLQQQTWLARQWRGSLA